MNIPQRARISVWACLLFPVLMAAAGCSTPPRNSPPAEILLQQGIKQAQARNYQEASASFKQLLEDYPDSQERVAALLRLADTLYLRKEYEEAKFNYQKFIELYPAHPQVDRAHFYRAMCDYRMTEIAVRDQTQARNAIEQFDKLIDAFPKSPYRQQAILKKKECVEKLARNMFEIGKFYYRNGSYQSAIKRMISLLEQYPGQAFNDEAMYLLAESYYNEQNREMAEKSYSQLIQQYPRSVFVKDARERLKSLR
ncbi:MAG: outer membrane protein assembly factor BamD [Nitrospinae bacterium]|nr:outer membrane protein assembly factor BamD [Nitrospinota bacterium]